jgi:hypothetical protein
MAISADRFPLWQEILGTARYAPSPHNVQPWRVSLISDDEAELFIDGARTLPNEDHTGSFLLSAMGMFLEAISLLAAPHEMSLEVRIPHSAEWYAEQISRRDHTALIRFASLRLVPSAHTSSPYPPSLFLTRRTSRISLQPAPVPESSITALAQLAATWGHQYTHITAGTDIEQILEQNIRAVFNDMNVAPYHDEITSWFRFTDRSAKAHKDGLDWRCMNLSKAEFWLSARTPKLLLFPPTRLLLKRRYRKQLGVVPSVGILSGDFFHIENAVHSGRFLLRFWMEVARLGLYLHPYGNLVTNPQASAWLEQKTGVSKIWLVFKLGFSDEPPLSYRRSVDDILISATDKTL